MEEEAFWPPASFGLKWQGGVLNPRTRNKFVCCDEGCPQEAKEHACICLLLMHRSTFHCCNELEVLYNVPSGIPKDHPDRHHGKGGKEHIVSRRIYYLGRCGPDNPFLVGLRHSQGGLCHYSITGLGHRMGLCYLTLPMACASLTDDNGNLQDIRWLYKRIVGHHGPLRAGCPNFKHSRYNVVVKWENGQETQEPLNVFRLDAPVICFQCAERNGLLDVNGWRQVRLC